MVPQCPNTVSPIDYQKQMVGMMCVAIAHSPSLRLGILRANEWSVDQSGCREASFLIIQ